MVGIGFIILGGIVVNNAIVFINAVNHGRGRGASVTEALVAEDFGPGERNYIVETPLANAAGAPFRPGHYTAEAWLTSTDARRFTATAGFEIRDKP